ncbi:hypothetical protein [Flavobacterium alkalisoli]|nr:hypothetical protein [Flavobacterium alkalisoli]
MENDILDLKVSELLTHLKGMSYFEIRQIIKKISDEAEKICKY